tara:strand:- start:3428 stop:4024 length:597 start_codon:yes stop_codon:yes gene_type:complete
MTFKPPVCEHIDFRKGVVSTSRPWNQPDINLFHKWIVIIKRYIADHQITIDLYLCGKFLENPKMTWDIDVILSHKDIRKFNMSQLQKIRDLMNYGMQLGFDKFNLLIDMACYLPFDDEGTFWYSAESYIKHGKIRSQALYTFDKISEDDEVIQDFNTEHDTSVTKICDNLFMVVKTSPSEKHINRIKKGIIYKKPVII